MTPYRNARYACAYCGQSFVAERSTARFCGSHCRQASYRQRSKKSAKDLIVSVTHAQNEVVHKNDKSEGSNMPRLLTVHDVAEILAIAPETVRKWARQGRLPAPLRVGSKLRFDALEIQNWVAEQAEVTTASEELSHANR